MKCPDCINSGFSSIVVPIAGYNVTNDSYYYYNESGEVTPITAPTIMYICSQKHIWFED